MKQRYGFLVAAVAFALTVAGCSGRAASVAPLPPAGVATTPPGAARPSSAVVSFRIDVPQVAAAGKLRGPRYVSAATKSATIAVSPGATAPVVVACTTVCAGQIAAPIGTDTFTVKLYDAANGSGNLLSTGTLSAAVVLDAANAVNLTFNGVVSSVSLSTGGSGVYGTSASIAIAVNAVDAAGNTIVGPGSYVDVNGNPVTIALSNSDTSGHTRLSTTSVSQPTAVTIAYDGASYASATLTASVGTKTATALFTVACGAPPATTAIYTNSDDFNLVNPVTVERFALGTNANDPTPAGSFPLNKLVVQALALNASGLLYEEGQLYGPSGFITELIETFCSSANSSVPRSYISVGANGQVNSIAVDSANNVYAAVDTFGGRAITEFASTSEGFTLGAPPTPTPALRTIVAPPDAALSTHSSSIGVDGAGNMYLSNADSVLKYAANTPSGAQAPASVFRNVPTLGLLGPIGVATDALGDVFGLFQTDFALSATAQPFAIGVFSAGNLTTPVRVIAGPAAAFGQYNGPGANSTDFGFATAIAVDAAGTVFVLNRGASIDYGGGVIRQPSSVTVFAAGANGNVAPTSTIDLSPDSVHPTGLAVDATDHVYVSDSGSVSQQNGPGFWYEYALNGTHVRTVKPSSGVRSFTTIAVDPTGIVAVASATANASDTGDILFYGLAASGNASPSRDLSMPHAALVTKLGFDAAANLYVEKDASADHSFLQLSTKRKPQARRRAASYNPPQSAVMPSSFPPDPMISVYGALASGAVGPTRSFTDPVAFNSESPGLSVASDGTVYVADFGASALNRYAPAASGANVTPQASYWYYGPSTVLPFVAVNAAGDVVITGGTAVSIYAAGSLSLTRSIAGPLTKITNVIGLAVDTAGDVLVLDGNLNAILVFGPQQSGNVAPLRVISRTEYTTPLYFLQVATGPG